MDCTVIITHQEDGDKDKPHKTLRIYDMRGQALGFGQEMIADTKIEKSNELDLFSELKTSERCITYLVSLELKQLSKYLENDNHKEE